MIAFRREKFVPFGGPSGGDGGRGGDIIIIATKQLNTLYELSFNRVYRAKPGENGMSKDKEGAQGKDCIVNVPIGTLIYDNDSGELLADLDENEASFTAAPGGKGGRGNAKFANSVRRAPRIAEKGEAGKNLKLRLELKLLADVGLVGLPNAGKSTLLRAISNAKPKVADYPFTTLVPNLGIVKPENAPSFCVADLPGLIEGAHEGAGLGLHFLKHIERTRLLVHLVDLNELPEDNLLYSFDTILTELKEFDESLIGKPMVVIGNKIDLPEARSRWIDFKKLLEKRGFPAYAISGATKEGIVDFINFVSEKLATMPAMAVAAAAEKLFTYLPPFVFEKAPNGEWNVNGTEIERLVQITDFSNDDAIMLFKNKIRRIGFLDEIKRRGLQDQDLVRICEMQFYAKEFF